MLASQNKPEIIFDLLSQEQEDNSGEAQRFRVPRDRKQRISNTRIFDPNHDNTH